MRSLLLVVLACLSAGFSFANGVDCGFVSLSSRSVEADGVLTATYFSGAFRPEKLEWSLERLSPETGQWVPVAGIGGFRNTLIGGDQPQRLFRLELGEVFRLPFGEYRVKLGAPRVNQDFLVPCAFENAPVFGVGGGRLSGGMYAALADPLVKRDGAMRFRVATSSPRATAVFFQRREDGGYALYNHGMLETTGSTGLVLPEALVKLPDNFSYSFPIFLVLSENGGSQTFLVWDPSQANVNVFAEARF